MRLAILTLFSGLLAIFATTVSAFAEKRVALVIGNGTYTNATPLPNPPMMPRMLLPRCGVLASTRKSASTSISLRCKRQPSISPEPRVMLMSRYFIIVAMPCSSLASTI